MEKAKGHLVEFRMAKPQPWSPSDATDNIRQLANGQCTIHYKMHARDQMRTRELTMVDVMHVLQNGFVYEKPEKSTRPDLYKYGVECATPNSHPRVVRLVVIPCAPKASIKIITVMWRDE